MMATASSAVIELSSYLENRISQTSKEFAASAASFDEVGKVVSVGDGICGMKNIYSSKSLLDNWVEDNFGRDLVAMNRSHKLSFETEAASTHINPAQMVRKCTLPEVKVESVEVVKAKNKEGMPYSLLFGGNGISREEYKSTAQLSAVCNPDNTRFSKPDQYLEHQKSKSLMKERDSSHRYTTEYRSLSSRLAAGSGPSVGPTGDVEDIPDFRRRKAVRSEGLKTTPKVPKVEDPTLDASTQDDNSFATSE